MWSRLVAVLACVALSGCAFLSDVKPIAVPVSAQQKSGPLQDSVASYLGVAAKQEKAYQDFAADLTNEQKARDAATFLATTGLSATAIFRGGANSLRYAGFFAGLTVFYDKAIPISARIDGARTAGNSFTALILAGNDVLKHDLDGDLTKLRGEESSLSTQIAAASVLIAQPPAAVTQDCKGLTADACAAATAKKAQAQAQQEKSDLTDLMTAVTAGKAVQAKATAADGALSGLPLRVAAAIVVIDGIGQKATQYTADKSVIAQAFVATPPPAASGSTPAPKPTLALKLFQKGACPSTDMEEQAGCVKAATDLAQSFLDAVDYVGLDNELVAATPKVAAAAAAAPAKPSS